MKILKSRKALSPVVASIILIAVTVAVSIAVAAWMGALTIGFMGSSAVTITNVKFETGTPKYINCTLKNTGTNMVTIAVIKINNSPVDASKVQFDPTHSSGSYASGATGWVRIQYDWVAGNPYKIDFYDSSGQVVGSYQANAPQ